MKRIFDILFSLSAIILLLPIMIIVASLIRFDLGRPIFFVQVRPGKDAKLFKLVKFRTMRAATDENGQLLSDLGRITSLGNLLRKTSLDELPELWNVLIGDMSLVGPRPLLVEYLPLYSAEQSRRHDVRPGITGWAQVNGRNAISWEEKFEYDIWYVNNQNIFLDLKIIWMTLKVVVTRKGVNAPGHATTGNFKGNYEN